MRPRVSDRFVECPLRLGPTRKGGTQTDEPARFRLNSQLTPMPLCRVSPLFVLQRRCVGERSAQAPAIRLRHSLTMPEREDPWPETT